MKSVFRLGVCVGALWAGSALAQDYVVDRDEERTIIMREEKGADDGLYVLLGGGAEGYTGALASDVNIGPSFGAHVGFKPTRIFGVELGYSGGLSDIDVGPGGITDGADIMRNGAQAAATLGFTTTRLQPYVLGGIGFENYNIRGDDPAFGFEDDTNGYVPAGLGLRYQLGRLITADARVSYNFSFDQDFAPEDTNGLGDGRYQALLQLGGTY